MRVLIIGCGYVGIPLGTELVRLGHEVFGLRRTADADSELKAAGISPLVADVSRRDELEKLPRDFDWVVNTVSSTKGGAAEYEQVYLNGTRNLIALGIGVRRCGVVRHKWALACLAGHSDQIW